ncbi:hypothetical protein PV416_48090, partial [Streptomyces ipomoeae]|nr:hypothetical protein [Streptomyces ipomoeae]
HWVGHLTARRPVPVPHGPVDTPRLRITTPREEHRTDRHAAPPLEADAHEQPRQETASTSPTDH